MWLLPKMNSFTSEEEKLFVTWNTCPLPGCPNVIGTVPMFTLPFTHMP